MAVDPERAARGRIELLAPLPPRGCAQLLGVSSLEAARTAASVVLPRDRTATVLTDPRSNLDASRLEQGGAAFKRAGGNPQVLHRRLWSYKGASAFCASEGLMARLSQAILRAKEPLAFLDSMGLAIKRFAARGAGTFDTVALSKGCTGTPAVAASFPGRVHALLLAADFTSDKPVGTLLNAIDQDLGLTGSHITAYSGREVKHLTVVFPNHTGTSIKQKLDHVVDVSALHRAAAKDDADPEAGVPVHHQSSMGSLDVPANIVLGFSSLLGRVDFSSAPYRHSWPLLREWFSGNDCVNTNCGFRQACRPSKQIGSVGHIRIIQEQDKEPGVHVTLEWSEHNPAEPATFEQVIGGREP